jgi:hypothetical protein
MQSGISTITLDFLWHRSGVTFVTFLFKLKRNEVIRVFWIGLVLSQVDEVPAVLCLVVLNLTYQIFKVELGVHCAIIFER